MESENQKKASESSQITFKLSAEEKQLLENKAKKFDVPLSEYIRVKALDSDNQVFNLKTKVSELTKENRYLKIKLDRYEDGETSPDSIVLPCSVSQKELIEILFGDWQSKKLSLGQNILCFLFEMGCRENWFLDLSYEKRIKFEDVDQAKGELQEEMRNAIADQESDDY